MPRLYAANVYGTSARFDRSQNAEASKLPALRERALYHRVENDEIPAYLRQTTEKIVKDYQYRIYVYLAGETKMQLCEVSSPEAVAAVISTLCRVDAPAYTRLEIELFKPLNPGQ